MRIVIDLQGVQTESRFRGIGRYSIALAQAMAKNAGNHEIWLALNGLFPETVEPIRAEFEGLIPQERIRVFELPGMIAEINPSNTGRARAAELIREAFIASLKPDVVHVSSLFEGFIDDASVSISSFDQATPIAVTLYDLIPLLREKSSFVNEQHRTWYFKKLLSLKRADLLLAISNSSRQEGISTLQLDESKVANVSAAIDSHFRTVEVSPEERRDLFLRLGIFGSFILYMGGYDERKNLDRLIQAYAMLSKELRQQYILVLAGKTPTDGGNEEMARLKSVARESGLESESLIFTGYITDEDLIRLYNLCYLFVFPSLHEGFGLPPLEAMACGAIVIGSNRTSLPEVIGCKNALFDPEDTGAITSAMTRALTDEAFREEMRRHGLNQARCFSWDESAKAALSALEDLYESPCTRSPRLPFKCRYRLAYVSPLPPEESGIADYSAELLQELAQYYDIDIISDLPMIANAWVTANHPKHTVAWFADNAHRYDRILYQIGNSPFHAHMFELLHHYPGVVTLHDFFLSSVTHWMNEGAHSLFALPQGYDAVRHFHQNGWDAAKVAYPCNTDVFYNARGIIVHSPQNVKMACQWFGVKAIEEMRVIPLLRQMPVGKPDRGAVRTRLGIAENDFVVCSFGLLDPAKLNQRLLQTWLNMTTELGKSAKLIFVGANNGGKYGKDVERTIKKHLEGGSVQITGYVSKEVYENYLIAADASVQLRTHSRGETSKAILDCLAHGLPTIINDHGTLSDYPENVVVKLRDNFDDEELSAALQKLHCDAEMRRKLGKRGIDYVKEHHHPAQIGALYHQAIEHFYSSGKQTLRTSLINKIASLDEGLSNNEDFINASQCIATNLPVMRPHELLLDISATARNDLKTGIERVVRALVVELIVNPPSGYRVEPVYLCEKDHTWHYRYARRYTLDLLALPENGLGDEVVDPAAGDILVGLDIFPDVIAAEKCGLYQRWRNRGVSLNFVVYDLLPILRPDFFPPGSDKSHAVWLNTVSRFSDRLVGISKSVADELTEWLESQKTKLRPLGIEYFHLGADIASSVPTQGVEPDAEQLIKKLQSAPTFLMVGTIEPRKGYLQTIAAFELLWAQGISANLVIVGKEGWKGLPDSHRRTIPEIVTKLMGHPESGKHLFWLEGISDEYLDKIYAASNCLIAASEGEGFGLPLIEAAQYQLPIIARDILVFREVAQQNAYYFSGLTASELAASISAWLNLKGNISMPIKMQWNTWKQAAQKLAAILTRGKIAVTSSEQNIKQKAIDEHLNLIHAARVIMVSTLLPQGDYILDLGGANCPLYKMGYPHHFKKLSLIDLPPDQRHNYYKDIVIDSDCPLGPVVVQYTDMTTLDGIADESIDFVWSGQSIEHVPPEAGERMCHEIFRVLRKGGVFCLDTPNRRLTEIHTATVGGGFIHPEHYIEYHPEHLVQILNAVGFSIENSYGICEMPETLATGEFHYEDFMFGKQITDRVADGYIQFFHCMKP